MSRPIDADALMETLGITDMDCYKCAWGSEKSGYCDRGKEFIDACSAIENAPTIEPEREKDIIQKFHDYQVEWLTSHCDLELEQTLEGWVVRFLHDTANCFMMEMERGEQDESD